MMRLAGLVREEQVSKFMFAILKCCGRGESCQDWDEVRMSRMKRSLATRERDEHLRRFVLVVLCCERGERYEDSHIRLRLMIIVQLWLVASALQAPSVVEGLLLLCRMGRSRESPNGRVT
jgi:hypothetical protein